MSCSYVSSLSLCLSPSLSLSCCILVCIFSVFVNSWCIGFVAVNPSLRDYYTRIGFASVLPELVECGLDVDGEAEIAGASFVLI